jgi:hypothetical protein
MSVHAQQFHGKNIHSSMPATKQQEKPSIYSRIITSVRNVLTGSRIEYRGINVNPTNTLKHVITGSRFELYGININPVNTAFTSLDKKIRDEELSSKLSSTRSQLDQYITELEQQNSIPIIQDSPAYVTIEPIEETQRLKELENNEKNKLLDHIIDFSVITWFDLKVAGFDRVDAIEFYKDQVNAGHGQALNAYLKYLQANHKFYYILASFLIPMVKSFANLFLNPQNNPKGGINHLKEVFVKYFKDSNRARGEVTAFLQSTSQYFKDSHEAYKQWSNIKKDKSNPHFNKTLQEYLEYHLNQNLDRKHSTPEALKKKFNLIAVDLLNPNSKIPIIGKIVDLVARKVLIKILDNVDPVTKLLNSGFGLNQSNTNLNYTVCKVIKMNLEEIQKERIKSQKETPSLTSALSSINTSNQAELLLTEEIDLLNDFVINFVKLLPLEGFKEADVLNHFNTSFLKQKPNEIIESGVITVLNKLLQNSFRSVATSSPADLISLNKWIDILKDANTFFKDQSLNRTIQECNQIRTDIRTLTKNIIESELKFYFRDKPGTYEFKEKKDLVIHLLDNLKIESQKYTSQLTDIKNRQKATFETDITDIKEQKNINNRVILITLEYLNGLQERFNLLLKTTDSDEMGGNKLQVKKLIEFMIGAIDNVFGFYNRANQNLNTIELLEEQISKLKHALELDVVLNILSTDQIQFLVKSATEINELEYKLNLSDQALKTNRPEEILKKINDICTLDSNIRRHIEKETHINHLQDQLEKIKQAKTIIDTYSQTKQDTKIIDQYNNIEKIIKKLSSNSNFESTKQSIIHYLGDSTEIQATEIRDIIKNLDKNNFSNKSRQILFSLEQLITQIKQKTIDRDHNSEQIKLLVEAFKETQIKYNLSFSENLSLNCNQSVQELSETNAAINIKKQENVASAKLLINHKKILVNEFKMYLEKMRENKLTQQRLQNSEFNETLNLIDDIKQQVETRCSQIQPITVCASMNPFTKEVGKLFRVGAGWACKDYPDKIIDLALNPKHRVQLLYRAVLANEGPLDRLATLKV